VLTEFTPVTKEAMPSNLLSSSSTTINSVVIYDKIICSELVNEDSNIIFTISNLFVTTIHMAEIPGLLLISLINCPGFNIPLKSIERDLI